MRSNYPLLSQELNDKIFGCYENMVYLLGQNIPNEVLCSGLYSELETFCSNVVGNYSGIPNVVNDKVRNMLKFDYIYRKHFTSRR